MAADINKILAGIKAGGSAGLSLAWFGPLGTAGPVGVVGTAGVQTVTITGTPTAGTFTLTWNGYTTAPIVYNAASAVVQAALRALPGGSTITATGGPLPTAVAVTFPATVAQTVMTGSGALLTGGSSPAVNVVNTTPGVQTTNPATAPIPASFLDGGWCDQKGLAIKTNVSSNDTKGFGSLATLRTIVTDAKKTIELTFLEHNAVSIAVYNSLPLGSVVADGSGYFRVINGSPQTTQYAALFDVVDGANHMRYFAPQVQNITPGDLVVGAGQIINRPISLTLYPDALGNTLYEDYVINALAV
jgi:phage tail protein X